MILKEKEALIITLRNVLHKKDTVLFLGSGISVWSGLPNWNSLIEELACFVAKQGGNPLPIRKEISSPLLAASYGVDQLSDQEFREFIRQVCREDQATPHKIHKMIATLGPTCFVTTNYDHLFEDALGAVRPQERFQLITNRQSIDCHAIMQVTAKNFILKLHGDINDTESIVLTTKQYNRLYGERLYALKALEMFLSARTVVFLGYSLRDPDFLHVNQALEQIFQRNNRITHYAIMPDISETEREYWRRNYGIKILSYETKRNHGVTDYSTIFPLLEELAPHQTDIAKIAQNSSSSLPKNRKKRRNTGLNDTQQLALIRYASALLLRLEAPDHMVFPLSVSVKSPHLDFYYDSSLDELLARLPENFILTGNPGAGKSFSLKRYCRILATALRDWGLNEKHDPDAYIVPIYIDLKYYNGSIKNMINSQFPAEICADSIIHSGKAVLVIDSFNEVEEKYLENDACLLDLEKYLTKKSKCIVSSRFDDNLKGLRLPTHKLIQIEQSFVEDYLYQHAILPNKSIRQEVLVQLQKPLFFRLLQEKQIEIDAASNSRSLYTSYFRYLNNSFQKDFGQPFDFYGLFKELAYQTINAGRETFSFSSLKTLLKKQLPKRKKAADPKTIVNWLAEKKNFLAPASRQQLSFFHQSVTEFLAAGELADRYLADPTKLSQYLQHTKWDYALLHAAEFLSKSEADTYIRTILRTDSILAIGACKYMESNTEDIVSTILSFLLEMIERQDIDELDFAYILDAQEELQNLPLSPKHEPLLRSLMHQYDLWGGIAAGLLYRLSGTRIKEELLEEMFRNLHDYNYLQEIGYMLAEHISLDEYATILKRLKAIPSGEEKVKIEAVSRGFGNLAAELPLEPLIELFKPFSALTIIQRKILCEIIHENKSQTALNSGLKMIRLGFQEAIFPVYMLLKYEFGKQDYKLEHIDDSIIHSLNILSQQSGENKWSITLIKILCSLCPPILQTANTTIVNCEGISKLIYLYAAGYKRQKEFIRLLIEMLEQGKLTQDIIKAFDEINLHLYGDLLLEKLIRRMDFSLLTAFLSTNTFRCRHSYTVSVLLSIQLINWATMEEQHQDISDIADVGNFLFYHIDKSLEKDLVDYFHTAPTPQKRFLAYFVFQETNSLRLEKFTQHDLDFLVEDLRYKEYTEEVFNNGTLLSNIATEVFVEEHLLPLLSENNAILQANLRLLLYQIGKNLGRRYQER